MVNHKHKFIFLHIPKTAGCSIGRTLFKAFNITDKTYEGFRIHHDDLTDEILQDYFVFTFVRNPWDRLWSQYKFRHFLIDYYPFNDVVPNIENHFKEYYNTNIEDIPEYVELNTADQRSDWYAEFIHLPSQVEFLNGKYNDGKEKLKYIDFVGRFENIQHDFDFICKKIGIPTSKLPYENVSDPNCDFWTNPVEPTIIKHYSQVYSEESIKYVKEKYKDDITTFNYSYERI